MSDSPAPAKTRPTLVKVSKTYHRLRLAVQIAAFLMFLYLLIGTRQETRTWLPGELFFLADPLAGSAAMLAGHVWIVPMLIGGLALLAATLVLGRVWCGWLCPLGSLLDWIPSRRVRKDNVDIPLYWRQGKNLTLFIILLSAMLGSLTLIVLDPVTLVFRSFAAAVLPLLNSLLLSLGAGLYHFGPLQPAVGWFDSSVRAKLFGDAGFYLPNLTLLALLAGVLALNVVRARSWCRYLCPLGGLLALMSRVSFFRYVVNPEKCISCGRCAVRCPTGAISPAEGYKADAGECVACLDCVENCPTRAITFPAKAILDRSYQPARRHFITSLGLAAVGAFTLRFLPTPGRAKQTLIRPPGASEDSITGKCIRCGECVRVCPSASIQPAQSASGWDSTWSPHLVMRRGYCDYSCNACGQVCPTGAIAPLSLEKKRREVIGVAAIDREKCIPFKEDRECIVCEEMCPLPEKAVKLARDLEHKALRPRVLTDVCTGCGICEKQCPVNGVSAIRVYPPGTAEIQPEE